MQHPFSLREAKHGSRTQCKFVADLLCDHMEVLIGERCFVTEASSAYVDAETRCKRISKDFNYQLHTVSSSFEQKWIAAFFSEYGLLWVKNSKADTENILAADFGGRVLVWPGGHLSEGKSDRYAIVTRKGLLAGPKPGTVVPVADHTSLPLLCSRPGTPGVEYVSTLAKRYEEAGMPSYFYLDRSKVLRPFIVLRGLHSFLMDQDYDAKTEDLHRSCEAFANGYAATPYDFENVTDFKKILKQAKVNIVAVPGRRTTANLPNLEDCSRDPKFKAHRSEFVFDLKAVDDKKTIEKTAKDDQFWSEGFPDRTCADMPRVALGFTQNGLIDIPNIARHFVVCTFGTPPNVKPDDGSEKCHSGAKFEKGKCHCSDESKDITKTKQFFRRVDDSLHAEGTLCVDCSRSREFAIVLLADQSQPDKEAFESGVQYAVSALKFTFASFQSHVRMMYLRGDKILESGQFYKTSLTKDLSNDWMNMKESFQFGAGSKLYLKPALTEAYSYIRKQPQKHKLILILLSRVPDDAGSALEAYNELRSKHRESGHVEVIIAAEKGADNTDLKKLSSSKEVFTISGEESKFFGLLTKIHHTMLRLVCIT